MLIFLPNKKIYRWVSYVTTFSNYRRTTKKRNRLEWETNKKVLNYG